MSVKRSQSAARVLKVFEEIARHQPIGVSDLAKQINADKSATQRDIMTLADCGWIRTAPGKPTRWELTAHILTLAHMGHGGNDLRKRARSTLEALQKECGETVLLTVADGQQFVVIDIVECEHFLRTTAHIGLIVPVIGSATSRAILPFMNHEQQQHMLGVAPDERMQKHFQETLQQGYAVSVGDVYSGSTNIAAAIFSESGEPIGAIVISAPTERLQQSQHPHAGKLLTQAAQRISAGPPRQRATSS